MGMRERIGALEDELKARDKRIEELKREIDALVDRHNTLVSVVNKLIPLAHPQPVGRPLAANEAQQKAVIKLHRKGMSLRGIVDETSLSFRTVRTIVGQINGTDRTTAKHRARLAPVKDPTRRSRDTLPRRATEHFEKSRELAKTVKGLGRD